MLCFQAVLVAYENDRVYRNNPDGISGVESGFSCGGDGSGSSSAEAMAAITRNIRYGERLKAYPTCTNHAHIPTIMGIIRHNPVYRDVVLGSASAGSRVRFALRVKVFAYPENVMSLWCVIASCTATDSR